MQIIQGVHSLVTSKRPVYRSFLHKTYWEGMAVNV